MMFALGVVAGISLSILLFLIELYLVPRKKGMIQSIESKGEKLKPRAKIFFPKTEEQVAQEGLVDKNAAKGEGTLLKDLGL